MQHIFGPVVYKNPGIKQKQIKPTKKTWMETMEKLTLSGIEGRALGSGAMKYGIWWGRNIIPQK